MTGPVHIGDALARALDDAAVQLELVGSPKAQLVLWLATLLKPVDAKTFIVEAATEHVAMLLPCEAIALIKALDLESV